MSVTEPGLVEYPKMEQRSPEWFAARRGIITASAVGKLLTVNPPGALEYDCPACRASAGSPCVSLARKTPTAVKTCHGERIDLAAENPDALPPTITVADNDSSRGLTLALAAERIAGFTEDAPLTSDMWRGVEMEPFARDHYSGHYQQAVECGFMRRDGDGWTLGLSPDGLVGTNGGVEIKCPRAKTHVAWTLADEVPPQHMAQVQAALLVSGRAWWDFVSYCGGLPLFVKRVTPDPMWHAAIIAACRSFEATAAVMVAEYTKRVEGRPVAERIELEIAI